MTEVIRINQGDATTITETVTGLASLAGYTAKLYIYTRTGTLVDSFDGTISGLTITYNVLNEDSRVMALGYHRWETKLWDSSDHVYTPSSGTFIVESALVSNPS